MMKKSTSSGLATKLGISPARAMEAVIKAKLIRAVQKELVRTGLTHDELAKRSGLPRSAVTGILSGSLQKVTIDRVLRLIDAAQLVADVRIRSAA